MPKLRFVSSARPYIIVNNRLTRGFNLLIHGYKISAGFLILVHDCEDLYTIQANGMKKCAVLCSPAMVPSPAIAYLVWGLV